MLIHFMLPIVCVAHLIGVCLPQYNLQLPFMDAVYVFNFVPHTLGFKPNLTDTVNQKWIFEKHH